MVSPPKSMFPAQRANKSGTVLSQRAFKPQMQVPEGEGLGVMSSTAVNSTAAYGADSLQPVGSAAYIRRRPDIFIKLDTWTWRQPQVTRSKAGADLSSSRIASACWLIFFLRLCCFSGDHLVCASSFCRESRCRYKLERRN